MSERRMMYLVGMKNATISGGGDCTPDLRAGQDPTW
jgi:hypothetical protein